MLFIRGVGERRVQPDFRVQPHHVAVAASDAAAQRDNRHYRSSEHS